MNNDKNNTVSDELDAVGDRIAGEAKNTYGAATGDESIEREGENQAASGAQRQRENRMLSGLFNDKESADRTYSTLRDRGYTDDDINILATDQTRDSWFDDDDNTELGSKALEGTGVGSAVGGTLGAIIGGIAAIGSNVILPGVGLVVAGPLAAALAGAGAGGLTGGLVGALIGSGIPEERAQVYEEGIKNGGMVVGFNPKNDEDAEFFQNHYRENKAEHVYY